jgi:hypothetical protein
MLRGSKFAVPEPGLRSAESGLRFCSVKGPAFGKFFDSDASGCASDVELSSLEDKPPTGTLAAVEEEALSQPWERKPQPSSPSTLSAR